jgi:hypothetical protein
MLLFRNPLVRKWSESARYDQTTDNSALGITAGEWVKARVIEGVDRGAVQSEIKDQPNT